MSLLLPFRRHNFLLLHYIPMASSSSSSTNINSNHTNTSTLNSFPNASNYSLPNTTFVQADPSTFRAVVQRLTGASHKLPATRLSGKPNFSEMGPRRPTFKLHERRPTARKLENIKLNNNNGGSAAALITAHAHMVMVSPVSTLECWVAARGSPKTPMSPMEEEEKAIAEKGFYLHPSPPFSTPRKPDPPELLPLFPLQSP